MRWSIDSSLKSIPGNAAPRDECEEKCAKLRSEMEEMKQEKNEEVRRLKDELKRRRSERTTTRTTSLKLKIEQMMRNKNIVQKQKHWRSSGMNTTSMSRNWRSWNGTVPNPLSRYEKLKRSTSNLGRRQLSFQHGKEVLFLKFVLRAETVTSMNGKLG